MPDLRRDIAVRIYSLADLRFEERPIEFPEPEDILLHLVRVASDSGGDLSVRLLPPFKALN